MAESRMILDGILASCNILCISCLEEICNLQSNITFAPFNEATPTHYCQ